MPSARMAFLTTSGSSGSLGVDSVPKDCPTASLLGLAKGVLAKSVREDEEERHPSDNVFEGATDDNPKHHRDRGSGLMLPSSQIALPTTSGSSCSLEVDLTQGCLPTKRRTLFRSVVQGKSRKVSEEVLKNILEIYNPEEGMNAIPDWVWTETETLLGLSGTVWPSETFRRSAINSISIAR
ncbi:hypothetical protein K440DRAFT_641938 [Wilcoxina mikolae CBS 423.85]|nr:hypothetical protein K440DRAFT_641938 [Wilcoxina mikolae CBS 423.85]